MGRLKGELSASKPSRKGIGHTGTLDPFAQGLLLVGVGEGTKLLPPLQGLDKTYRVEMVFTQTSPSLDTESEIVAYNNGLEPIFQWMANPEARRSFLSSQRGDHEQVPPELCAVKIDGRPAYELARKGQLDPERLKPRSFQILDATDIGVREFQIAGRTLGVWIFDIRVSSGTYIRALARDWGRMLFGRPGMLTSLTRIAIGPFVEHVLEGEGSMARALPRSLTLKELDTIFDLRYLGLVEREKLIKTGNWRPLPQKRHELLIEGGLIWGWTEGGSGRIGRLLHHGVPLFSPKQLISVEKLDSSIRN